MTGFLFLPNPAVPKLIHMIYFPWDRHRGLLPDQNAFDRGPYEKMVAFAQGFEVQLWTFDKAKSFCTEHYPDIWKTLVTVPRPTMMVDVLRWLLVYHFGGIYWQYSSEPFVRMKYFLPRRTKQVRLLTEFILTPAYVQRMAELHPICRGNAGPTTVVCNGAFSAAPRHPFAKAHLDFILDRIRTLEVKEDYDVLYICANGALSTMYDQVGKLCDTVELVPLAQARAMVRWNYKGTWGTDPKPPPPIESIEPPPPLRDRIRQARLRAQDIAARVPGLRPIYRIVRRRLGPLPDSRP